MEVGQGRDALEGENMKLEDIRKDAVIAVLESGPETVPRPW